MAFSIAISGKGGTGKSTLSALLIRSLVEASKKPVLAVDADANATLGTMLGVPLNGTVADLREDVLEGRTVMPAGMSKPRYIEYLIQQSVAECEGFDLVTMGRPEGPKCYCYVNNLLRGYLDAVGNDYPFVVIDNEAGMEHLSRRTTNNVDLLLAVSEPTKVGIASVRRILQLADELPITVNKKALVLNKVPAGGCRKEVETDVASLHVEVAGRLLIDQHVANAAATGESLLALTDESSMLQDVRRLVGNLTDIAGQE